MPLEVAASKIGVSEARLQRFESGDARPTTTQLRTIAKVYRRPAAFFYLETLPELPERINDFRLVPGEHEEELPNLLDAVEAARERREIALELSGLTGQDPPEFGFYATLDDQPDEIANALRELLGIRLLDQRRWRDRYVVLRKWINAAEAAGVLVTQFSGVEVAAARGFTITARPLPLVALNGKDSPRAKVFTLFHELVHITLGATGLCDLHDAGGSPGIEPFCNQVAADALVPAQNLLTEPLVTSNEGPEWEDWQIRELAVAYSVSQEVILRRLLTLGRTTQAFYRQSREEYLEAYAEANADTRGFLPFFRRILRDNGVVLTRLVLDAYRSDLVTPTEASRLLGGVKLRHVPAIEEALQAHAG